MRGFGGFLKRCFNKKALAAALLGGPALYLSAATPVGNKAPDIPLVTDQTQRIARYNHDFKTLASYGPVIFIDRDRVYDRAANADANVPREKALQNALQDIITGEGGRSVNDKAIADLSASLSIEGGQSTRYYVPDKTRRSGRRETMCIVMPQSMDVGNRDQQQRIMGLDRNIHGDLIARQYQRYLAPDVMQRFTDYHELGHCLDESFIPELNRKEKEGLSLSHNNTLRHQAEVRAEVFAVLMLARDGVNNVAEIRADQRLISLAVNGYGFTREKDWSLPKMYLGYVYALHEGLWDSQRTIDQMGLDTIRAMTPQDIAQLAKDITDRNPLSISGADRAVTLLLEQKFDLTALETKAEESDTAKAEYHSAFRVRGQIAEAFRGMFGAAAFAQDKSVFEQIPLDREEGHAARPLPQSDAATLSAILLEKAGEEKADLKTLGRSVTRLRNGLRHLTENAAELENRQKAAAALRALPDAHRMAAETIQTRTAAPKLPPPVVG